MARLQDVWKHLVASDGPLPFVLIDGAGLEQGARGIPTGIFSDVECLFSGELAEELRDVAPYVGRLASLDDLAEKAVSELVEGHSAILVLCKDKSVTLSQVHRHLRKFNTVYGPDGIALFFRYYDPRVIVDVLGVLEPEQLNAFFGPIGALVVSDRKGQVKRCYVQAGRLEVDG